MCTQSCDFSLQMDGRGSVKELFPTGKQLEPLVAPLADGKVAVGQDDLTVVLNEEGVCTQKCALNWTDIPVAMGMMMSVLTNMLLRSSKATYQTCDIKQVQSTTDRQGK